MWQIGSTEAVSYTHLDVYKRQPGGLILDPFAGAGTTVLAAVMTGYRAVGIEVTDAYYKLGSDRVKIALEAEQKEDEK